MENASAEGWFVDPYGRHEQRWMSNGEATTLVRDGGVESTDAPLGPAPAGSLVRAPAEGRASPADVLRSDGAVTTVVPTAGDVADVIYDRNMFFSSVPLGYQERLARRGRRSRTDHWWMTRRGSTAGD